VRVDGRGELVHAGWWAPAGRRVRVLQIAPPWFSVPPQRYGGTEAVVAALTDGLVAAGHDVTLVASGASRTRAGLLTVYDVPPSADLGDALVELPHLLAAYRSGSAADVVHDHSPVGAAIGSLLDGPPVVHTVHGTFDPRLARLYRDLGDRVTLVAISHDQAGRAPEGVPIGAVVHNGIPLDRYPFQPAPGRGLAFVGRASADKGADLALDVAERLGWPLAVAVKVNEADERSWWEEVLRPRLLAATVPVRLVVDANHREKVELLSSAAVLLFPIRWDEPFGLVPVEAGAVGTPVVAFARGALPEIVADGRSGRLVAPEDVDAMCAAVEEAAGLDRSGCRRWVAERFPAERMVAGYVRVYDDARRASRARRRRGGAAVALGP
jgi:glycosyltransferase involved in cell wall biosynthesis